MQLRRVTIVGVAICAFGVLTAATRMLIDINRDTKGTLLENRIIVGPITGSKCLHSRADGTGIEETGSDCGGGGGGGLTGSGTNTHMAAWSGSTSLADTSFIVNSTTLKAVAGNPVVIGSSDVASGSSDSVTIQSGTTSSASSSFKSGNANLNSSNTSNGAKSGDATVGTGSTNGLAAAGNVVLSGALSGASTSGGDIVLRPGSGSSIGGIIKCNDKTGSADGCNIVMYAPGGTLASAAIVAGTGAPSGSCQAPLVNPSVTSIPVLYLRTDPASSSTLLYVCIPPSTWTAITVP